MNLVLDRSLYDEKAFVAFCGKLNSIQFDFGAKRIWWGESWF
jgi:hypothetical protein